METDKIELLMSLIEDSKRFSFVDNEILRINN